MLTVIQGVYFVLKRGGSTGTDIFRFPSPAGEGAEGG